MKSEKTKVEDYIPVLPSVRLTEEEKQQTKHRRGFVLFIFLMLVLCCAALVICLLMANGSTNVVPSEPIIYETTEEPTTEPATELVTEELTTEPVTEPASVETKPVPEITEPETKTEPESTEPSLGGYTQQDLEYLAIVIYREAGADYICDDCRRRVGDIVLTRVESDLYPDTIHSVLTQKQQYGNMHWTGVVWPESAKYDCNRHAVERARRIAEEVLTGHHSDVYGKGWFGQAEYSIFQQNYSGGGYVYCCGIYFFDV